MFESVPVVLLSGLVSIICVSGEYREDLKMVKHTGKTYCIEFEQYKSTGPAHRKFKFQHRHASCNVL